MEIKSRIIIYPKDVAMIMGRNERYGRMVVQKIKILNGKESHQFVSIKELSTYLGISQEEIRSAMLD